MDLNLETLKTEILEYLEASDFAIFRSHSGGLDGMDIITWDAERFPDYRMFLDAARKAGQSLILFASREFDEAELEEASGDLEQAEVSREEQREFERRFRAARRHLGHTCSIEIAFDHNSHLYVYEVQPDWYEEFLETCDELSGMISVTDEIEDDGHDSLGGYYSNN